MIGLVDGDATGPSGFIITGSVAFVLQLEELMHFTNRCTLQAVSNSRAVEMINLCHFRLTVFTPDGRTSIRRPSHGDAYASRRRYTDQQCRFVSSQMDAASQLLLLKTASVPLRLESLKHV